MFALSYVQMKIRQLVWSRGRARWPACGCDNMSILPRGHHLRTSCVCLTAINLILWHKYWILKLICRIMLCKMCIQTCIIYWNIVTTKTKIWQSVRATMCYPMFGDKKSRWDAFVQALFDQWLVTNIKNRKKRFCFCFLSVNYSTLLTQYLDNKQGVFIIRPL